jgi:hypothetical protein
MTKKEIEQVLIGSLLGDGSIGKYGEYHEIHCPEQKDYLIWKKRVLDERFEQARMKFYKKHNYYQLYIPKNSFFQEYRKLSYPDGKKRITNKFIDKIGKLAIVIWYFDDGSYSLRTNLSVISSYCFTYKENQKLQRMLKNRFGLNFGIFQRKYKNQSYLACHGENTNKFLEFIKKNAPYIPKSMTYKMGRFDKRNKKWVKENIKKIKKARDNYNQKNKKRIAKWRKNNPEKIAKWHKDWVKNNPEKIKIYRRKWKENNPEKIKESKWKWYEKNKDKIRKYNHDYNLKNKDKIRKYCKKYYKNNKEYYQEYMKKYYLKKKKKGK